MLLNINIAINHVPLINSQNLIHFVFSEKYQFSLFHIFDRVLKIITRILSIAILSHS